jgi:hypothetical protein
MTDLALIVSLVNTVAIIGLVGVVAMMYAKATHAVQCQKVENSNLREVNNTAAKVISELSESQPYPPS